MHIVRQDWESVLTACVLGRLHSSCSSASCVTFRLSLRDSQTRLFARKWSPKDAPCPFTCTDSKNLHWAVTAHSCVPDRDNHIHGRSVKLCSS